MQPTGIVSFLALCLTSKFVTPPQFAADNVCPWSEFASGGCKMFPKTVAPLRSMISGLPHCPMHSLETMLSRGSPMHHALSLQFAYTEGLTTEKGRMAGCG